VTPIVSVRSVSKSFTTVQAVSRLSFEVARGEIFALLGPNGAGKTTMVRMLVGITRPDSGSIEFRLSGGPDDRVSPEALGYLPEERGLYRETPVLRTLVYFAVLRGMGRADARRASEMWLDRFGLLDRAREKTDSLSKGNQQKVQFISAILHRPSFAILDEPFSGLDPINQEFFLDVIRELRDGGMTILLSAHQMNLVEKISDRVLLINEGQEILRGTMEEIRTQEANRSKLVLRVRGEADVAFVSALEGVERCKEPENGELVVWTSEGASLSAVLAELSRRLDLASIHSEKIALHEVYVEAVGGRATPTATAEVGHGI
jgi:ABC-2 type transport system ATP-binding protein